MGRIITIDRFTGLNEDATVKSCGASPNMLNFCITPEYKLSKRPGFINMTAMANPIKGLWSGCVGGSEMLIFASGGKLCRLVGTTVTELGSIDTGDCEFFEFDGKLYILTGSEYYCYDGYTVGTVSGYIPTVSIATEPSGAGTAFEEINLLTDKRAQKYSADGTSTVYHLAETGINEVTSVTVNDVECLDFTADTVNGTVTFDTAPTEGINNVVIIYRKVHGMRTRITHSRFAIPFGGSVDTRVFVYGNPGYSCYRFHSELTNGVPSAEYFPVNNFTVIGNTAITCISEQYDRQLIFTKDRAYYSPCEVRQNALGAYYTSFPVYNLNGVKGSVQTCHGTVIGNEPVTVCDDGINIWNATSVQNQSNAKVVSSEIYKSFTPLLHGSVKLYDRKSASELFVVTMSATFVYNYLLKVWYRYSVVLPTAMAEKSGETYFAMANTIYKLDPAVKVDDADPITAYWCSPLMALSDTAHRKNLDEISLCIESVGGGSLTVACFDDISSTPGTGYTVTAGIGTTVCSVRAHRKRIARAGVYISTSSHGTDETVSELVLITKTKGRNDKNGLQ